MPTTPATAGPEWIPRKVEHTCMQLCSFSDYSLENRKTNLISRRQKKEATKKKKEQKGKRNKRKQNRIEHRLSKNRISITFTFDSIEKRLIYFLFIYSFNK